MARTSRKSLSQKAEKKPIVWNAGMYLRLSVEDIRKKENDSIGTQKMVVEQYLEKQDDIYLHKVYRDINFTGTNFERPDFQNLIEDLKKGIINCVIVKDLSRFGRNYIEAGNYLEKVFPFLGVRFISVNDNYDSLTAESIDTGLLIPLKNIMHEVYARDISKKVRSQYELKRKKGEFCGAFAPYGYVKCGNVLEVDEQAAQVVKQIFGWFIEGQSVTAIAEQLNNNGIMPPSRHRYENGVVKADRYAKCKYWYSSEIKRILKNKTYIGILAQGKYTTSLFQPNHKPLHLPEEEWVVVEGTHPAIIDNDTFYKVQEITSEKKAKYYRQLESSNRPEGWENIFLGLVVCGNCGSSAIRRKVVRDNGNIEYFFLCSRYEKVSKEDCRKLYFPEVQLRECVEKSIEAQISLFCEMQEWINEYTNTSNQKAVIISLKEKKRELQKKKSQIEKLKQGLETDFREGVITEVNFEFLRQEYAQDIQNVCNTIHQIDNDITSQDLISNEWVSETGKFVNQELDAEMIANLIRKICLYPDKTIQITLNYQDAFQKLLVKLQQEVVK